MWRSLGSNLCKHVGDHSVTTEAGTPPHLTCLGLWGKEGLKAHWSLLRYDLFDINDGWAALLSGSCSAKWTKRLTDLLNYQPTYPRDSTASKWHNSAQPTSQPKNQAKCDTLKWFYFGLRAVMWALHLIVVSLSDSLSALPTVGPTIDLVGWKPLLHCCQANNTAWLPSTNTLLLYQPNKHWVYHNDVIKWKHFPCYWPFVRGIIHRSPVNSPHKGQWRGAVIFSLICAQINGWVNNCEAGDLRRHRAHYDVIAMYTYK